MLNLMAYTMKRIIVMVALLATIVLSACDNESERTPRTELEALIQNLMRDYDGQVDMEAFLTDAQKGVWFISDYEFYLANGEIKGPLDGASLLSPMMLFPDGTCRYFISVMPAPMVYSDSWRWSVSTRHENTIEIINSESENPIPSLLELWYYKDGVFIMKGKGAITIYASNGTASVDYCLIVGHIATDTETVNQYLSYGPYNEEYPYYRDNDNRPDR